MKFSNSVEVYGIRETLAEIRDVDKNLFFAIRAYMKRAGDTLGNRVLGNTPIIAPTSGFRHSGRTAWKPGTFKTEVSGRNAKKGATGATPLLRVKFGGVALNIADMAGKGGARTRRARTRSYAWNGTMRTHAVSTQGRAMIAALGKSPSRYIWAEAETALPMIQNNVLLGVEQYMSQVNRKFEVIGSDK
jgi:hypothetical protein